MKYFCPIIFIALIVSVCNYLPEEKQIFDATLQTVFDLPEELSESSGLIIFDSLFWTFNDSGHGTILYGIDMNSGSIRKRIHIQNAVNNDWEDITQDSSSVYVADTGNGYGSRGHLTIYILHKADILDIQEQNCLADSIHFIFEDQADYTPSYHATSFDCEALVSIGDSLYVFTKDWIGSHSVIYSLPRTPGSYIARRRTGFDSEGLVSGATYNPSEKQIALCGYSSIVPFVLLFHSVDSTILNTANPIRYEFAENPGYQIEGIDISDNKTYLTCENSAHIQACFILKVN
jgi:hypothetical protein